jgi:Delta3-Delta2-enoyl-CoA isomerase
MVGPKYTIGLNETKLGIVAPKWFMSSMLAAIPYRNAELALTTGQMFSTDEALKVGLIDEIASDKADAIARAEKFLSQFAKIHRN